MSLKVFGRLLRPHDSKADARANESADEYERQKIFSKIKKQSFFEWEYFILLTLSF